MADRTALDFSAPSSGPGSKTVTADNGREWTWNNERSIWQLSDVHVLVFEGGTAINVGPGANDSVETNFDMDKVSVAAPITETEV